MNWKEDMQEKQKHLQSSLPQAEEVTPVEQIEVDVVGAALKTGKTPDLGKMKIDLHCHTEASPDCSTPIDLIPDRLIATRVYVQAITDHNQIWGALKLKELVESKFKQAEKPVHVIIGEEISTTEGEIIGLFLNDRINAGLSSEETVLAIQEQGGLTLIPHGFDPWKRFRLLPEARERIIRSIDIIETFNARISNLRWNQAAVDWAKSNDLLMSAGSDAHRLADIGTAWVEAPYRQVVTANDLALALERGIPTGVWTHPILAYIKKMWNRLVLKLRSS